MKIKTEQPLNLNGFLTLKELDGKFYLANNTNIYSDETKLFYFIGDPPQLSLALINNRIKVRYLPFFINEWKLCPKVFPDTKY